MQKSLTLALSGLLFTCIFSATVHAHLMVAQHGTLNVKNDGIYMVLSLPVTAFTGTDDDLDGKLSMIEFNQHRADIIDIAKQNITLSDNKQIIPLKGIMLQPVMAHHDANEPMSQIIIMGKFIPNNSQNKLTFETTLFGTTPNEQQLKISATRSKDKQEHQFGLSKQVTKMVLFSNTRK